MYTVIRYGEMNSQVMYIAWTPEDVKQLETMLDQKKSQGQIKGYNQFRKDLDLPHVDSTTMSEALSNMDLSAFEACSNVYDLDDAIAFYGEY